MLGVKDELLLQEKKKSEEEKLTVCGRTEQ